MANITRSPSISILTLSIFLAILVAATSALPANLRLSNSTSLTSTSSNNHWPYNSVLSPTDNATLAQSFLNAEPASPSRLSIITSNLTLSTTLSALSPPTTILNKYIIDLASSTAQGGNISTSSAFTLSSPSSPSQLLSEVKVRTNGTTFQPSSTLNVDASRSSSALVSTLAPNMTGSCLCVGCTSSSWITGRRDSTTHSLNTTIDPFRSSWAFLSRLPPRETGSCACDGCTTSSWVTSRNSTAGAALSASAPPITSTRSSIISTANPFQSSWAFPSALAPTIKGSCSFEGCSSSNQPTPNSQHIIEPTNWGNMPPAPIPTISHTVWSSSSDNAPPIPTSTRYRTILSWNNVPLPTLPPPPRPIVTKWITLPISTVTSVYTVTTVTRTTGDPGINTMYTTPVTHLPSTTASVPPVVVVTTITSVIPAPPPRKPQCSKHPRFNCCIYEAGHKDGIRECFGPGPRPGHPQCHWATVGCCADYQKGWFIHGSCRDCRQIC